MSEDDVPLDEIVVVSVYTPPVTPTSSSSEVPFHGSEKLPLYHRSDIPEYLHRGFLLTHYRAHYTLSMCTRSLFAVHNDTGNVWTHLIGGLLFVGAGIYTLAAVVEHFALHYLVFALYMAGVLLSMLTSAAFHLYCPHHSEKVFRRMLNLDYIGVSAIILGSSLPAVYVIFACHPTLRILYMVGVSAVSAVGLIGPLIDRFHTERCRVVRTMVYFSVVIFSLVPYFHGFSLIKEHIPYIGGVLGAVSIYGVGMSFYLAQIPERWWPGRFDVWFHSHQIWHVCCLLAAAAHFVVLVLLYRDYRRGAYRFCL